jgi:glycerol kinase
VGVYGMAGDQQAALFGQGCVEPGSMKNTYGTGCFLLLNLGRRFRLSKNRLLTTLACDAQGAPVYALEGAVFAGGAAVQWLRDGLGLLESSAQSQALAASLADNGGVYLVPAFVGLGAPHWDSQARGLVCGLTRGSTRAHLARAALESMAYQSGELIQAMQKDSGMRIQRLRVDGGASKNDWLMRFQAGVSGLKVERPAMVETTALGAAMLAGVGCGALRGAAQLKGFSRVAATFKPAMTDQARAGLWRGWAMALRRTRLA